MSGHGRRDGLRWFHGLILLLVCSIWARVWIGPVPWLEVAQAQIPDAGRQRQVLVEETRRTTELLAEIKTLLKEHTFNVRLEGADNQADAPPDPRGTSSSGDRP